MELRGPGVLDEDPSWQNSLSSRYDGPGASINLWRILGNWVTRPWRTHRALAQTEAALDAMTPDDIARERAARTGR